MTVIDKASLLAGCCFLLLSLSAFAAGAETAVQKFRVGDAEIWAIADSLSDRGMDVFKGADPAAIEKYVPTGKTPSAIMTFAVRLDGKMLLLDTGLGNSTGRVGNLMAGLAQAGIAPEDIETILITHMHGDHIGGLIWDDGQAFPNADVLIGKAELDFWLDEKMLAENPGRKGNFDLARRVADLYGDRIRTFGFGETVVPGITSMAAVGHTPGHVALLLESGSEKLLCIGDLLHAAALQFPRPDINASFDMNPEQAAASRVAFLDYAAANSIPIAGMHLPFAGVGRVEKASEGGFRYTPLNNE